MRGKGSVALPGGGRLQVDYDVRKERKRVATGSGTWLAAIETFSGTVKPIPEASPKPYTLELTDGNGIRFYSDGTAVTFSGEVFQLETP